MFLFSFFRPYPFMMGSAKYYTTSGRRGGRIARTDATNFATRPRETSEHPLTAEVRRVGICNLNLWRVCGYPRPPPRTQFDRVDRRRIRTASARCRLGNGHATSDNRDIVTRT
jgi:hypothetical protein